MDESEQRIVAHEMALIEVVAHVDRDHIAEGIKAIRAGLVAGITEEERVIRCMAIDLLEDAMLRYAATENLFEGLSAAAWLTARLSQIGVARAKPPSPK